MANLKDLIVQGTSRFVGKIYGLITKAEGDQNGDNIVNTYLKKADATTSYAAKSHTHTSANISDKLTATGVQALGWNEIANQQKLLSMARIAYWNGAYTETSSNLAYCNKGAFGTMATQNTGSYSSATQVNTALAGKSGTGHTHSYLPLSGGIMTGTITSRAIEPSDTITYNLGASNKEFGVGFMRKISARFLDAEASNTNDKSLYIGYGMDQNQITNDTRFYCSKYNASTSAVERTHIATVSANTFTQNYQGTELMGHRVHQCNANAGTAGALQICKMTIATDASYVSAPMRIQCSSRYFCSELLVYPNNSTGGAWTPTVFYSQHQNNNSEQACRVCYKVSGRDLYLYVKKQDSYEALTVNDVQIPTQWGGKLSLSWTNVNETNVSSLTNASVITDAQYYAMKSYVDGLVAYNITITI